MKANNNIKQLKEIVNNDLFFDLNYQGVQAYNISANEYEVITGFRKCNGRYYFVDRNRNKYLVCRYDRAEFIAGEMLEQKARENKMVNDAIESIEKTGEAKIIIDLSWEYVKTCKARGINPGELVDREEDEAGELYMIHRIESAKDEENSESEESATACEPSHLADILAKVKNSAKAAAEKMGFIFCLLVVFAVGLLTMYGSIALIASIVEALGLCGSFLGALLGSALLLTVGLDFMCFVVINVMAILAHFFPSEFEKAQKPHFVWPASFWYTIYLNSK